MLSPWRCEGGGVAGGGGVGSSAHARSCSSGSRTALCSRVRTLAGKGLGCRISPRPHRQKDLPQSQEVTRKQAGQKLKPGAGEENPLSWKGSRQGRH